MPMLRAKKANLYAKTHRSGNQSWCVNIGRKADGKADVRSFPSRKEAENFFNEWNLKLVQQSPHGLSDLNSIQRHEILAAVKKLEAFNATIPEAVDFFLKYSRPDKGEITVAEALKLFLEKKAKAKCSTAYLDHCQRTFFGPFAKAFPNRVASEITALEVETYVHSHKNWNAVTTKSHINYLSTFFAFLIKQRHAKLNPLDSLDRPKKARASAKVLTVDNAEKLLQFALDEGNKAECAAMALVFFCGVRVEEVSRLTWADVNFETRNVTLEIAAAKQGKRRVNPVPPNAWEWLNLCKATGSVAPANYSKRMQRLRKRAAIKYPQNAMRHCFSGYHLAAGGDAPKTAFLLGHPNPKLLYETYHELVSIGEAARYWNMVPKEVAAGREVARLAQEKARDDRERADAEAQSNCNEANFSDGKWVPVTEVLDAESAAADSAHV